ncbi:DNA-binding protein [Streptomyces sp. NPDC048696]|uniref:DNA-binding protein n=1 Tax=Streptomyces sp. NPDC048696 TaxID=3365585 RepID=UPI00371B36B9
MTSSVIAARRSDGVKGGMTLEEVLALPVSVSVSTAAKAFGIGPDKAYGLIKAGAFPAKTIPVGDTLKVATVTIWRALGIEP